VAKHQWCLQLSFGFRSVIVSINSTSTSSSHVTASLKNKGWDGFAVMPHMSRACDNVLHYCNTGTKCCQIFSVGGTKRDVFCCSTAQKQWILPEEVPQYLQLARFHDVHPCDVKHAAQDAGQGFPGCDSAAEKGMARPF